MSIHIISGGTNFHIRPHLALSAPAYGTTGDTIQNMLLQMHVPFGTAKNPLVKNHRTKMAGGRPNLDTNDDVAALVEKLVADPETKIIFMPVALCDYTAHIMGRDLNPTTSGKDQPRLQTRNGAELVEFTPAAKVIAGIRKTRKDIFLVGFKTTVGETPDVQFAAGLRLLKTASCNLVLANDIRTRLNMVITPEQTSYHVTTDREEALGGLVEMALLRSKGTFTRSTVLEGENVPWESPLVPASLRKVVNHLIARGAYKPFLGTTVGHFAVNLGGGMFLTSKRKTNFNNLNTVGMVLVEARGNDSVIAHGARPSVGGQSQRIVFEDHPQLDCIVHAHVPLRAGSEVNVRSQLPYECGSHECGKNTSDGLRPHIMEEGMNVTGFKAVMLDKHGPNVVFNRNADPDAIIRFMEANFDLAGSTAGYRLPKENNDHTVL